MLFKLLLTSSLVFAAAPERIKKEARELLSQHQFKQALDKSNELIESNYSEALYLRSHIHMAMGQLNKAYEDAVLANAQVPGSVGELLLHKVELERENFKMAGYHLENAKRLYDYTDTQLLNRINLAQLKYLFTIKNHKSLVDIWKGTQYQEEQVWADLWAARAEWALGNKEEARQVLDKVLKLNRDAQFLIYSAQFTNSEYVRTEFLAEAEKTVRKELEDGLIGHRVELAEILLLQNTADSVKEALGILNSELYIRNTAQVKGLLSQAWKQNSQFSFEKGQYTQALFQKVNAIRFSLF